MNDNRLETEKNNTDNLNRIIKKFSFPRLAGSIGEKKAVELTKKTFFELGFEENQIKKQTFKFSNFYSDLYLKINILLNIFFVIVILLIRYIYTILTLLFIAVFLIIFLLMIKILRYPEFIYFWEKYFSKISEATNIFVKVNKKEFSNKNTGDIIVSAHLDSKSQTFKTYWRVIFSRAWLYGELSLGLFYTFFLIDYHQIVNTFKILLIFFEIGIVVSTCLVILSNIFLFFLKTGNKSSGSLDNATGMAVVFELSSFFRMNPLERFNLWFCQFSAEELGTIGSRNFVDLYEKEFSKGMTYQFNFDMLSSIGDKKNQLEYLDSYGLFPRKKSSPLLTKIVSEVAQEENIKLHNFHISVGAHTDSIPFHLRKYDILNFTTRSAAIYSHSKEDTPDKVDLQILKDTCRIVIKSIIRLDSYNKQEDKTLY